MLPGGTALLDVAAPILDRRLLALVILALCTVLTVVGVLWTAPGPGFDRRGGILAVLAVALLLRAVCSLAVDGVPFDIQSLRILGDTLRHGGDIYTMPALGRQNYAPMIEPWAAIAAQLVPADHPHRFAALVKAPFWIVDAGICLVLHRLGAGLRAAWLYAVSPIAITIAAIHGQFDSVVVVPVLLAVAEVGTRPRRAALLAGLGVALKPWPAFFVPALLSRRRWREWPGLLLLVAVVPVAAFALYALYRPGHILSGLTHMVGFGATPSGLGTATLLFTAVPFGSPNVRLAVRAANLLAGLAVLATALLQRRRRVGEAEAMAAGMMVLLTLSPTVEPQFLLWPVGLLLLAGRPGVMAVVTVAVMPLVAYLELFALQTNRFPGWLVVPAAAGALVVAGATAWLLATPRREPA